MLELKDASLLKQLAYIDGQWVGADNGETLPVNDPATGEIIAEVPNLGAAETERAIASAEIAQKSWAAKTGKERAIILRRWFDLMIANTDDLAYLMTREQGKPLAEARGEIAYAASFIEWFAEEAKRVDGEVLASPAADKRLVTLRQPVGVCAAITPWNFPAAMITRKVAPALAAGCAIVIKPSELTPLSAFALAELGARAGIPAGVVQVLTGHSKPIGGVLTSSPIVRKLSFTGSTEVGRLLMAQCAPTIKRLSLELGGNAPFIVFDDADVDAAVEGAIAAKYRNGGQTCVCANRFYIQDGIYDKFAEKFAARAAQLPVGNGLENGVLIGPLIEPKAVDKVKSLVDDARAKGARVMTGGGAHALGGTFYAPTVIADATADMRMAREEIFGPVAPLFRFKEDKEAIAAANATEFGLAAYLYTRDIARAWKTSEALEYGMVGLNTGLISNEVAPFGGIKQSGVGREGSRHGIEEYLEIKYLCLQM
ncbi:NAD-dependent succinate-semialdehyde dehydrogenase [Cupriavidus plantarum]|uniref:Succinate semialdehyde dehydrogenase n=1 Tax=Cupriavidus plantarum TaxID=942865 RepID=A0A316ESK1_9BURK|nr:NAD-dependent succinate-semialdehyde dehydrogenase [Cupriavidus plantarum]PWK35437.1 succinate semialdehyde dehydrogenase [Cupriavidus plantarum]CAG2134219.1 Glutarate-semialdehyde dehydrogenase [Cupriavidus plantarum]SMR84367.1 succinate semialdehyde dehydrogenase [Cupriavidus plantarum]